MVTRIEISPLSSSALQASLLSTTIRTRPLRSLPRTRLYYPRTMTSRAVEASRAVLKSIDLSAGYDPEQTRLMEERCILVDEEDNALGAADKKTCASPISPISTHPDTRH